MNLVKPYLGCKIALISKAQNRYVGILYTIDKVNSTVVLAKVKCLGTEGRLTDRPTLPREDVYEYITFRGSDITDISLCEPPPSHHGLPPDPAILLSSGAALPEAHSTLNLGAVQVPVFHQFSTQPRHGEYYASSLGIGLPPNRPVVEKAVQTIGIERSRRVIPPANSEWEERDPPARASARQALVRQPARPQPERDAPYQRPPMRGDPRFYSARRDFDYRQNAENIPPRRRQGSWRGWNRHTDNTLRFDTDFDFDFSNAQFIKEQESSDSPFEDDPFGPNRCYNKAKSFYDNIPSEKKIRLSWAEERQRNLETFGAPGRPVRSPGFRGGFSRGRGPRTGQGVFAF